MGYQICGIDRLAFWTLSGLLACGIIVGITGGIIFGGPHLLPGPSFGPFPSAFEIDRDLICVSIDAQNNSGDCTDVSFRAINHILHSRPRRRDF